jgi:hypothetical protein
VTNLTRLLVLCISLLHKSIGRASYSRFHASYMLFMVLAMTYFCHNSPKSFLQCSRRREVILYIFIWNTWNKKGYIFGTCLWNNNKIFKNLKYWIKIEKYFKKYSYTLISKAAYLLLKCNFTIIKNFYTFIVYGACANNSIFFNTQYQRHVVIHVTKASRISKSYMKTGKHANCMHACMYVCMYGISIT